MNPNILIRVHLLKTGGFLCGSAGKESYIYSFHSLFFFFFSFFFMLTIFKVFIEFVTILLHFMFFGFLAKSYVES